VTSINFINICTLFRKKNYVINIIQKSDCENLENGLRAMVIFIK